MIFNTNRQASSAHVALFDLEGLEDRRLLSAGHITAAPAKHSHAAVPARHVSHTIARKVTASETAYVAKADPKHVKAKHGKALAKGHHKAKKTDDHPTTVTPTPTPTGTVATPISTQSILYATAPAAVQTGLQAQAPAGVRVDPNKAIDVLTFQDGTVIYATDITVNGTTTHLSVDANGNPATAPLVTPPSTQSSGDDAENDDKDEKDGGDSAKKKHDD